MTMKTYQYRIYPNRRQRKSLENTLRVAQNWYNMCVAERKYTYEIEGRSVSKNDQLRQVKHYKATFPQARPLHSHILQNVVADVDKAFKAFFRRVKAGQTPGYPRFKSYHRFHSFGFKEYGNGFKLDGRRLKLSFIGRIRVRWHRPVEGTIKACRIVRKAGKWYVSFSCDVPNPVPLPPTGRAIGIDVGISKLITTSEGYSEANPNFYRKAQGRLRILQRKLARAKRGSNNRKDILQQVQRQHQHIKNQRKDYLDKLVFDLVQHYDYIALEDVRIQNMVRNKHLSKSILDSGWGYFAQRLIDKAVDAGRTVAFVDPAYTYKTCSSCGTLFENLTLADRWVRCDCGLSLDRDHNAAINILNKSLARTEPLEVT